MNKPVAAAKIESCDPIWDRVRREAEETSAEEPVLASLIYATILSEPTLEDAVCHTLANRLQPSVDAGLLHKTFRGVLGLDPSLGEIFRADLHQAIAANPFITFFTVATESGTLEFRWTDDNGKGETASAKIAVE